MAATMAAPLLHGLPDDIVIYEILVRLPPTSILHCRAVCRDWRHATFASEFLLAHHGRQPCLPVICFYDFNPSYLDIVPIDHRAGVAAADQMQPVARLRDDFFDLEASCDGLLIISGPLNQLLVCNPATRQYALLPQTSGFAFLGMYLHHNTGEYRLLLCPEHQDACHVLALGSCQPPRNIDIECPDGVSSPPIHVLLRSSLHWHLEQYESESDMILVFNTTDESFRQMRYPVDGGTSRLFEMEGMLAMYNLNDSETIIDVWVLRGYESEVWAFKCRVALPVEEISVQFQKFDSNWDVMVTSSEDDVLVLVRFGDYLLQLDIDGKLVASFECERLGLTSLRLKQTLVSHSFFPTLEGDLLNDSPFM